VQTELDAHLGKLRAFPGSGFTRNNDHLMIANCPQELLTPFGYREIRRIQNVDVRWRCSRAQVENRTDSMET